MNIKGIRRKKCPFCGGKIEIIEFTQSSRNYKITRSGRISKRYTVSPQEGTGCYNAVCGACGTIWETCDFEITPEGFFMDYRYEVEDK